MVVRGSILTLHTYSKLDIDIWTYMVCSKLLHFSLSNKIFGAIAGKGDGFC